MLCATRGHNYDFDSYLIVAEITERGDNVYAETARYNYGPVWFHLLHILKQIASILPGDATPVFRYLLAGFLSLVDLGIFFTLRREADDLASALFFLNPISIIITGYHAQFGNLAILLGMWAILFLGDDWEDPLTGRKFIGIVLIGCSLMVKHILFAFPLWLATKQRGMLNKLAIGLLPILLFLTSFVPYWPAGHQGIIENVVAYSSFNNKPFFLMFVPQIIGRFMSARAVWIFLLIVFAFVFRSRSTFDSLLLYTCVLVAPSPSVANQYLAIVIPFVAVHCNLFLGLYTIAGTWHLLVDRAGLNYSFFTGDLLSRKMRYASLVLILCIGFVWSVWHRKIREIVKRVVNSIIAEARIQARSLR